MRRQTQARSRPRPNARNPNKRMYSIGKPLKRRNAMNSHHWNNHSRLRGLLLTLALLLAPLSLAATPALAAPSCATSGATVTCTFSYTGAAQTWSVPAGVTAATFEVVGAPGGTGDDGESDGVPRILLVPGGKGARLHATLPLTPGSVITVLVGGPGSLRDG